MAMVLTADVCRSSSRLRNSHERGSCKLEDVRWIASPDVLTYRHTIHMLWHMRTTVRLDERLLERARKEAERRGATLTSLIEEGLQLVLRRPLKQSDRPHVDLPECRAGGGTQPGVDLNDSAALLDRMEERR
jgi:hypothetical protein